MYEPISPCTSENVIDLEDVEMPATALMQQRTEPTTDIVNPCSMDAVNVEDDEMYLNALILQTISTTDIVNPFVSDEVVNKNTEIDTVPSTHQPVYPYASDAVNADSEDAEMYTATLIKPVNSYTSDAVNVDSEDAEIYTAT